MKLSQEKTQEEKTILNAAENDISAELVTNQSHIPWASRAGSLQHWGMLPL